MTKDGILFRLGAKVSRVKDDTVYYEFGGQNCQVKSDMVLMAVGRVPNTQGLNAKGIGIEFDRKAIRTDAHMRTNIPHIYAIGDVNGKVMLAHTASHEGMVAVADICGQGEEMRYDRIPSCVYLEPEIACIGLTEALDLDQVPASVTVIGGGVIGVEFAYLLNRLGSKVTVLELMDHILPMVDIERKS